MSPRLPPGRPALSAAADQQAEQQAGHACHPDGLPGIVMHVVVRRAGSLATAFEDGILRFVQRLARAPQRRQGAVAQFVGLVAGTAGCFAQQAFWR